MDGILIAFHAMFIILHVQEGKGSREAKKMHRLFLYKHGCDKQGNIFSWLDYKR